jgi:hypothetical protein
MSDLSSEQALTRKIQPRSPVEEISTVECLLPEISFRSVQRRSYLTVASQYSMSPIETPASTSVRSRIDFREFSVGPWTSQTAETRQKMSSMYVFGRQDAGGDIPFTDAGVEYSTQCFCDQTIGSVGTLVADGQCGMLCGGSEREYCGRSSRLGIWSL